MCRRNYPSQWAFPPTSAIFLPGCLPRSAPKGLVGVFIICKFLMRLTSSSVRINITRCIDISMMTRPTLTAKNKATPVKIWPDYDIESVP